jgi:hypothetical protein
MTPGLPTLKQCPSPNYSPTPIAHDLVIVHDMEGGYEGSVAWLCKASVQASAHLCMNDDGTEFTQLVPLSMKAWAECNFNGRGVSIEMPGFVAKGFSDAALRGLAWATAWLLRTYGIPCQHAAGGQGRGFCMHHDLGAAGGNHDDICGVGDATWQRFEGFVKEAYDAFGDGPLPAWALHGLPAPHAVSLPPSVPPEPSHGGAARISDADHATGALPAHPTGSGFPAGSVPDMQWRLNKAGATPSLAVDGHAGPLTVAALVAFQAAHGLDPDGRIGPLTWAALDAATT